MRRELLALAWVGMAGCSSPPGSASSPETDDPVQTDSGAPLAPVTWRSALYPVDWEPGHRLDEARYLHDFSYAGYAAGERPLPSARPDPTVDVTDFGADATGAADSAQAFDDALATLTEGGTLWLPAGTYRLDRRVDVRTSGVVVAGEGADATFLHFTQSEGQTGGAGLRFLGDAAPGGEAWPLSVDADPLVHTLTLASAEGLSVGDAVALGWVITDAFVEDHGMTGTWQAFNGSFRPFFRRTVVAVEGDEVTLDVPLRYAALVRDEAALVPDVRYLAEVGVEDLAVSTAVSVSAAMSANRHHAIELNRVQDGWVRRVASWSPEGFDDRHLQSGGVFVVDSRRVTVAESTMGTPQNRGGGGNGYLFEVSRSNEVLFRDSEAVGGRHNFIQNWDFGTAGCVFLRTVSREGVAENGFIKTLGYSEFHHSLAMANLIDTSVVHDGWQSVNRGGYSSGAGHAGTQNVFWNLTGEGSLRSVQYGYGYVVGTGPDLEVTVDPGDPFLLGAGAGTAPQDHTEGLGAADTLEPPSLYEDQLARRLGDR